MSVNEVMSAIELYPCRLVELTGGEPFTPQGMESAS